MTEDQEAAELRELFTRVIADEPPLGFSADQAVRRGGRRLAAQRLATGGAGLAVVAAVGLAGTVGGSGPAGVPAAPGTPSPTSVPFPECVVVIPSNPASPKPTVDCAEIVPDGSVPRRICVSQLPATPQPHARAYLIVPCGSEAASPR